MKKLVAFVLAFMLSLHIMAVDNKPDPRIQLDSYTHTDGVQYIRIKNGTPWRLFCQVQYQQNNSIVYQFYVMPRASGDWYVRPYYDFYWNCWGV